MHLLTYVNNLPVVACMRDNNSETARSVVVCDQKYKGPYTVWSVHHMGGELVAENGHYDIDDYSRALSIASERAK
ncbi:hypothetical protein DR950_35985 [Kitasatospora xanthocidica]|uniref:Uncharacterized protein n=1 Tax=Kitasatospora xanthocidica TaxID=83382 RepID=A0A373A4D8_9ACTN|nr:hypothetical protein [Kitasatospora xanthocidica]RGD62437.1 hypothetical protein DR950_35985 [Kitasatospora xanthocidica]